MRSSDSHRRWALKARWGAACSAGVVTLLVLRYWRGFFWPHAVIVALAVAALLYSIWQTWDRMKGR
jgi:hypothetical protein